MDGGMAGAPMHAPVINQLANDHRSMRSAANIRVTMQQPGHAVTVFPHLVVPSSISNRR
jgi:hypothetical protein